LTFVGVGVMGGASVMGGLLWLLRRQIVSGDLVRVRLLHDIEPDTKRMIESYQPMMAELTERGVDVNMRLFRRKGVSPEDEVDVADALEADLVGAMAPTFGAATYGRKASSGARRHPLPGAATFSQKESDLWFPIKVELTGGHQLARGFVEAAKLPLLPGGEVNLYRAGSTPGAGSYLGKYRKTGARGFVSTLTRVS
jgi:hypothetical protein